MQQTQSDRRDSEYNTKLQMFDNRINEIERNFAKLHTEFQVLTADMPSLRSEIQSMMKKELITLTENYNKVEHRCHQLINERLQGYKEVYQALESKFNEIYLTNKVKQLLSKEVNNTKLTEFGILTQNIDDKIKTHFEENVEQLKNDINLIKKEIRTEQPKVIAKFIESYLLQNNIRNNKNMQQSIDKIYNKQTQSTNAKLSKSINNAEKLYSRLADDVYNRLQMQRQDTKKQLQNMESKLCNQMKQSFNVLHKSMSNNALLTQNSTASARKLVQSPKRTSRSRTVTGSATFSSDYDQTEIQRALHEKLVTSQQKLEKLEKQFEKRLSQLQAQTDNLSHVLKNGNNKNKNQRKQNNTKKRAKTLSTTPTTTQHMTSRSIKSKSKCKSKSKSKNKSKSTSSNKHAKQQKRKLKEHQRDLERQQKLDGILQPTQQKQRFPQSTNDTDVKFFNDGEAATASHTEETSNDTIGSAYTNQLVFGGSTNDTSKSTNFRSTFSHSNQIDDEEFNSSSSSDLPESTTTESIVTNAILSDSLDERCGEIQNSISNLQQMLNDIKSNESRRQFNKKIKKNVTRSKAAQRCHNRQLRTAVSGNAKPIKPQIMYEPPKDLPPHLRPHLSDLDKV